MNKYQEASNYLDWYCNVEHKNQQDLLQELVDREIPIKPIALSSEDAGSYLVKLTHLCLNCQEGYLSATDSYCSECGQKIDWSIDNE